MADKDCLQIDVCEKVFENIEEKIKVANHRIDDLEGRAEEINKISNVLVELQLLIKLQREDSLNRDKTVESINKSQIEITNTLKTLANNLNQTEINVDKLDKKVDSLDKKIDSVSSKDKISLLELFKKLIYAGFGVAIGLGVTKLFS